VFSTFRHTLGYLEGHLRARGVRVGLVHGAVPDDERRDLRARFAKARTDPEALDVLLSSEVGTEGLDYQFCDALVNYDLPWNPMRIEQRIGRIDRRGQASETVAIKNLVVAGTVDDECVVEFYRGDDLVGVCGIGMRNAVQAYRTRFATPA
jgi:superfamily II DNA/RNA helicase